MVVSINSLGPELIDIIVSHVAVNRGIYIVGTLAQYATISLAFQYAIERWTFSDIGIDDDGVDDIPTMTPERIHTIRKISYTLQLPTGGVQLGSSEDHQDITFQENDSRILAINDSFTEQLTRLFQFLYSLEAEHAPPLSLSLIINRSLPTWMDGLSYNLGRLTIKPEEIAYAKVKVRLGDLQNLPVLHRIRKLNVFGGNYVEGESFLRMASKCDRVEKLDLGICVDEPYCYPIERQEHRHRKAS